MQIRLMQIVIAMLLGSVKSVSRTIENEPNETHAVIINVELTNQSTSPLYIGLCCWKDRPLMLHNPAVEQLLPDGKWSYVGGASQDLPAPIWKRLEPGANFEGKFGIIDPYRKLSVPGGFDMEPGYSLPIRGKHPRSHHLLTCKTQLRKAQKYVRPCILRCF